MKSPNPIFGRLVWLMETVRQSDGYAGFVPEVLSVKVNLTHTY